MLSIPSAIQNLFLQESINKNFRISFPNGEYADITNEHILQEKVTFTESVCSRDDLKVGLLELSTLEFEAKNIPIITGLTINAQIEIDISSLPTNIQNAYGRTRSDVPFIFYPVPYGKFVVYETKQQAANISRVTAFSKEIPGLEYEDYVSTILTSNTYVDINYQQLIDVYVNRLAGYTGTPIDWIEGAYLPLYRDEAMVNGVKYALTLWGGMGQLAAESAGKAVIPYFTMYQWRLNELKNILYNARNYGFDSAQIQQASMAAYPHFGSAAAESSAVVESGEPYILRLSAFPQYLIIQDIKITRADNMQDVVYSATMSGPIVVGNTSYIYNPPTTNYNGRVPTVSYDDDFGLRWLYGKYNAREMLEGYLEARGLSARYGRYGGVDFFNYSSGGIASYIPRYCELIATGRTAER